MPPYRVITADPPWKFADKLPGKGRGADKHYLTLELHEIQRFPLPALHENAMLCLWRVSSMVEEAYAVVRAWGFVPKTEIVWVKREAGSEVIVDAGTVKSAKGKEVCISQANGTPADDRTFEVPGELHMGMGHYVRGAHETCIIATRGRFGVRDKATRTVFEAPVGAHSEKPEAFYRLVEKLAGEGPYVEMFARRERPGWTCFGNEVTGAVISVPVDLFESPIEAKSDTIPAPPPDVEEDEDEIEAMAMAEGPSLVVVDDEKEDDESEERLAVINDIAPATSVQVETSRQFKEQENWEELPFVNLDCAVCGQPQRVSSRGPVCINGHGGADGVTPAPKAVEAMPERKPRAKKEKLLDVMPSNAMSVDEISESTAEDAGINDRAWIRAEIVMRETIAREWLAEQ